MVFHSEETDKVEKTYFDLAKHLLSTNTTLLVVAGPASEIASTATKTASSKKTRVVANHKKAVSTAQLAKKEFDLASSSAVTAFQACGDFSPEDAVDNMTAQSKRAGEAKHILIAAEAAATQAWKDVQGKRFFAKKVSTVFKCV